MPPRLRHLAAAEAHARLAVELDSAGRPGREWVPTVLFYAAVHITEAALAERSVHPLGHAARAREIEAAWGESAADLFELLRDLSEQWRYSAQQPNDDDITAAKAWILQLLGIVGEEWPVPGYLGGHRSAD